MLKTLFVICFVTIIGVIGLNGCCCNEQQIEKAVNDLSEFLAQYYFDETETNIKDIVAKNPGIDAQQVVDKLINEKKTVTGEVNYSTVPGEEVLMLEVEGSKSIKMSYYYESTLFKTKTITLE